MPRIRTLKPDIWQDEGLGRCTPQARLLYVGIITQADDEGRFRAAPALLKAAVFPYDLKLGLGTLEQHLEQLAAEGLIRLYTVRGQAFGDLPTWSSHQRISHPSPSQLPKFESRDKPEQNTPFAGDSVKTPEDSGGAPESSALIRKGRERKTHMSSSRADAVSRVWDAYVEHHPRAAKTPQRIDLIRRRLKDHDAETLIAAIIGNHRDPYCNGENQQRRQYHSLELILRDADHVEKYAALGRNENGNGRREWTAEDFDRIDAERDRIAAARAANPEEALPW